GPLRRTLPYGACADRSHGQTGCRGRRRRDVLPWLPRARGAAERPRQVAQLELLQPRGAPLLRSDPFLRTRARRLRRRAAAVGLGLAPVRSRRPLRRECGAARDGARRDGRRRRRADPARQLRTPFRSDAMSGTQWLSAGAVLIGDGSEPLADTSVGVRDGRIVEVRPTSTLDLAARRASRGLGDTTLAPGFIDAHVHLLFSCDTDHERTRARFVEAPDADLATV